MILVCLFEVGNKKNLRLDAEFRDFNEFPSLKSISQFICSATKQYAPWYVTETFHKKEEHVGVTVQLYTDSLTLHL